MNPQRGGGRDDAGFTLVELLVALTLSALLGGVVLTVLLGAQDSVRATTAQEDLNAEARTALNRISRDLRQAVPVQTATALIPAISAVQNPDGAGHVTGAVTSLTFQADFTGDGCIAGVASQPLPGALPGTSCDPPPAVDPANPETVTYCWGGSADPHVYLVAGQVKPGTCTPASGSVVTPLLSGQITAFELFYRSNRYRYDSDGDGVTTWSELDAAGPPVGNTDGVLDGPELSQVNSVVLALTVSDGAGHAQSYRTQVDLRNVP